MKIKTLTNKDAIWPNELDNIVPMVNHLYMQGEWPDGIRVGVIGTRRPTDYGRAVTVAVCRELASVNLIIVSGLAIGVDSIAHQAMLEVDGRGIAVLPGGHEQVYPARHKGLAAQLIKRGCVVSEYAKRHRPQKHDFIARNRIIAALSDVLVVTEASLQSGTMHTVRFALELGKPVFAVPGQIGAHASEGTNQLLKDGAHVLTEARDVLRELGIDAKQHKADLDEKSLQILEQLSLGPLHPHELEDHLSFNPSETLFEMEVNGHTVQQLDGRIRAA